MGKFIMSKILSAHQPNFCPYAGIFEKIAQSDIFVLLNHVQFVKNGYLNRFYYKEKWYTMRCNQSLKPIIEKEYLYPREDWMKITNELPKLKYFDICVTVNLSSMNYLIIEQACNRLNIDTTIARDYPTTLTGTDRLINICQSHNADTYLSGTGGHNYLELDKFEQAGIKVVFQKEPDKRALIEII